MTRVSWPSAPFPRSALHAVREPRHVSEDNNHSSQETIKCRWRGSGYGNATSSESCHDPFWITITSRVPHSEITSSPQSSLDNQMTPSELIFTATGWYYDPSARLEPIWALMTQRWLCYQEGSSLIDDAILFTIVHATRGIADAAAEAASMRTDRWLCRCRTIFGTLSCGYFTGPVGQSIGPSDTLPPSLRNSASLPPKKPTYF